jgi:hypothetical protein
MTYINSILSLESENLSGCVRLRIARLADILAYPRNIGGKLISDIEFLPGKNWISWTPIEGTFLFQCQHQESMEGISRTHSIQFTLPAKEVDEYILETMQYDKLIALVTDRNYNNFVFGTPNIPLKFRYNRSSGNTRSGRNEYACFFLGSQFLGRASYKNDVAVFEEIFAIIDQFDNELIDQDNNVLVYQ